MTFLPIVERELREGSRRSGTYWLRFGFAASAIVVGVFCLFMNVPISARGPVLFWGLAGAAMFFCLFAGRISTADCISREKREGTLGLLFLTDLKGYDVVLGKLAATSVTGFFGLLAVIPVLAVPLMVGGIGKYEVGRAALVLVNTYFFSLAVGMFASSISRDYRLAMAANFFIISVLAVLPAGVGVAANSLHSGPMEQGWFFSCPIYTFVLAADRFYLFTPEDFWTSLALIHAEGWILVGLSCLIVPRAWRDKPEPLRAASPAQKPRWRWKELKRWIAFGSADQQPLFRKKALDRNPYYWLAARARLKPLHIWMAMVAYVGWWSYAAHKSAGALGLDFYLPAFVVSCLMIKLWVAQETVQRLGEDRGSDAFELLLSTPLSVPEILEGQWLSLRRQFLAPIILVLIAALAEYWISVSRPIFSPLKNFLIVEWLLLPLDVVALIWTGMFAALITRTPTRAVSFAVGRILALPAATVIVYAFAINLLMLRLFQRGFFFGSGAWNFARWWLIASLASDFGFGFYSWWMLRTHFRELAIRPPPFRSRSGTRAS